MGHRMRWRAGVLAGICLGLLGCQDQQDPVASQISGPQLTISPDGGSGDGSDPTATGEYPEYASESDIPPEYRYASILMVSANVAWSGATVEGYARMWYVGNWAKITLNLTVLHDYSTVATYETSKEDWHFLPTQMGYDFAHTYRFATAKDCGQVASQADRYEAANRVLLPSSLFDVARAQRAGAGDRATQPACPPDDQQNEPPGGGGGPGGDGDPGDTSGGGERWCLVGYWSDPDTGEIVDYVILSCWYEE